VSFLKESKSPISEASFDEFIRYRARVLPAHKRWRRRRRFISAQHPQGPPWAKRSAVCERIRPALTILREFQLGVGAGLLTSSGYLPSARRNKRVRGLLWVPEGHRVPNPSIAGHRVALVAFVAIYFVARWLSPK